MPPLTISTVLVVNGTSPPLQFVATDQSPVVVTFQKTSARAGIAASSTAAAAKPKSRTGNECGSNDGDNGRWSLASDILRTE